MIDPIWLEQMANRRWSKIKAISKAQKAVDSILELYPVERDRACGVLEKGKEIAIDELKDFQDEYHLAILTERSEHEQVIADMVEDVVDEKHIIEKVI
jgi:hypothetical protein